MEWRLCYAARMSPGPHPAYRLPALAALLLMLGTGAAGASGEENPYFNDDLFSLCVSRDAAKQTVCATYLSGFADGYVQNSKGERCYAPSGATLKEEFVAAMRADPSLLCDRSGGILFALMERLSSMNCGSRAAPPNQK